MNERRASDILMSLEHKNLKVWKDGDNTVCVCYENAGIKDSCTICYEFGRAGTFEGACCDYLKKISGKTLVFDAHGDERHEVTVLC
jgi:hypothetical protein